MTAMTRSRECVVRGTVEQVAVDLDIGKYIDSGPIARLIDTSRADKITMVVAGYPPEIKTQEISDDVHRGLMQYYRSLPNAPMIVPRYRMAQDGAVGNVLN